MIFIHIFEHYKKRTVLILQYMFQIDEYQEMLAKKRRKARWKWLLAYTLVNNPEISLQRRLVLAKERNENIKEILFSHSSSFTVNSTKLDLEDVIIQSERL